MRPLLFVAMCLVPVSAVQAQTSPTSSQISSQTTGKVTVFSLEDAVLLATQNNPRIIAAIHDIETALSDVRSAQSLTNPNAFFAPGVTRPCSQIVFACVGKLVSWKSVTLYVTSSGSVSNR